MMSRSAQPPSLKGRALRLLSGREHSRFELERKLRPHETEPGHLDQVLDDLQSKGFINEDRVIESVLHRRSAKLGVARIQQELQNKGLDPERSSQALAQLKDSELSRAAQIWQKKFDSVSTDPKERARQARFLLSRGFATEVVRKIVG
jgi:regulatory protein